MKIVTERDPFKEAVAWATRGLPARPTTPILAGLRLTVSGDQCTVSAFDYETSAAATFPLTAGEDGQILVSGRLLAEIAKVLPPFPVEITEDGTRALLTCGSAKFTLIMLPDEEYPALPELTEPAGQVGAEAFAAAIVQVAPAVGRDDTLPALTGIRIEFDGPVMRFVATDRYRLATGLVAETAWSPAPREDELEPLLIPAKTLHDAARGMTGAETVELYVLSEQFGNLVGLNGAGRRLTTRLLAGEFPKYSGLIPVSTAVTCTVGAGALSEAIKRVALVIERNTPIRLTFTDGQVLLEGGTSEEAQASEQITGPDVTFAVSDVDDDADPEDPVVAAARQAGEDGEFVIAFNPAYLLDAVGPLAGGNAKFQFTSTVKPAIIRAADDSTAPGYQTILVPVRAAG
jgi:DNA polymerase III subunit beta